MSHGNESVSYALYAKRADKQLATFISQNNGPTSNRCVSTNLYQLQQLQDKEMITLRFKKKKKLHRTNIS